MAGDPDFEREPNMPADGQQHRRLLEHRHWVLRPEDVSGYLLHRSSLSTEVVDEWLRDIGEVHFLYRNGNNLI